MSKILYNKYKDRLEITGDNKVAFYSQKREQLKTLYNDKYVVDLGGGLGYNISRSFIPNLENVNRRFIERQGNILIDEIANRNAELLLPHSVFDLTSELQFTSLLGVTISGYEGTASLSISGDSIICSGAGTCWNLTLSNGYIFPLPHTGVGYIIEDTITLLLDSTILNDLTLLG